MALRDAMRQAQAQGQKKFKYGSDEYEVTTSKKSQGAATSTRAKKLFKQTKQPKRK